MICNNHTKIFYVYVYNLKDWYLNALLKVSGVIIALAAKKLEIT